MLLGLILCECIPRVLSTPPQCSPPPSEDFYQFWTLPRVPNPRGRASRSYQKDHHALAGPIFFFLRVQRQEPRALVLCLWLLLLFLHVVQKNWTMGFCQGEQKSSSTTGLRKNTSFFLISNISYFYLKQRCLPHLQLWQKKYSVCFHVSSNIWVGDKDPAKSK